MDERPCHAHPRRAARCAQARGAVDGRQLIIADMGHQIDNMEGLSVHR